ncbi:hypothetical protein HNQ02_002712 [Flavobacterium sp. 7E]|uniref:leucine-rich repeat protein n=1 Tax=Flavobacterium sp. 7E TaxID=2735898 RepID=UPI00156DB2B4|nr:leucine-rich repeat protein [Flavobacterium sp. 7E]NRS89780.1 hypothetical protein [Flavobacterium sp. 7E]
MRKKLLLFIAMLCVTIASAQTFTQDGIKYTVSTGANVSVSSGSCYTGALNLPSTVASGGVTYTVTKIAYEAFLNCANLTSVDIPSTVTSVEDSAFKNCNHLTSAVISNSVTSMGVNVFNGCSDLTSVNIPNTLNSIPGGTFYACTSLTSISLPDTIISIGDAAFSYCNNLASINIPSSVTTIGSTAFNRCAFTTLNLPNSITYIGSYAFTYCTKLVSINIPSLITTIPGGMFFGCEALQSFAIPNGITSIGDLAFYRCYALATLNIPSSVTSIGGRAFESCTGLISVTCAVETPIEFNYSIAGGPITQYAFNYIDQSAITLYVPFASVSDYQTTKGWKDFSPIYPIGFSFTSLEATSVGSGKAILGGDVNYTDNSLITEKGIVWSKTTNPTTDNTKVVIGTGGGVFSKEINGLPSSSIIYYKTYAIVGGQTFYGKQISFATTSALPATHLNFDGVDDAVRVPAGINIANSSFTIEFDVQRSTFDNQDYIISQGEEINNNGLHIGFRNNNEFTFAFWFNDINIPVANFVSDNQWHHWACVYNVTNKTREVYQDGILVGSQNNVLPYTGSGILTLGGVKQNNGNNLKGSIDDVRIWNTARTAQQISDSRNCELQGNETGLVSYYKFNQGVDAQSNLTVATLTDATANGNNGTLTNFDLAGATSNWLAGSPIVTGVFVTAITTQPIAKTVNYGSNASFSVAATGTGLSYQWKKDNVNISGATGATLSLTNVVTANEGSYSCVVTGTCSAVTSSAVDLIVNKIPVTVTAAAKTKVYGTTDPIFNYTVSPSLESGDDFTGALSRVADEDVATYAITQGTLSAGSKYQITFVGANFSITKADQVISWNQTVSLGCDSENTVALTATTSSGLPISYTSSNTAVATVSNGILSFNNAGSATITASQAGNVNYNAALVVTNAVVKSQTNLIRKQFDDVIFFDNSSNSFKSYAWYKNGVLVAGQTAQYFKENGALNGTYYVMATKIDGTVVTTCPLTFSPSIVQEYLNIVPNPVKANDAYQLVTNVDLASMQGARVLVYNILGSLVADQVVNAQVIELRAPANQGVYIVKMILTNGKLFSKNLLVRN